jgi:gamma-glutamylcyclotransferase (GGCT)/AIG2-like uncharacterized protein YtfP
MRTAALALAIVQNENSFVNVFTYGSLMYLPLWERVVRGTYAYTSATLAGFARKRVRGEKYPGLVRSTFDSKVSGVLYFDVTDQDAARLDEYEGECYARIEVSCSCGRGAEQTAHAYIVRDDHSRMLLDDDWVPSDFIIDDMTKLF